MSSVVNMVHNVDDTFHLTIDTGYDRQPEFLHATVTRSGSHVKTWLHQTQRIHHRRLHHLVVGLDVEQRPNFVKGGSSPVAVLQLCVGRRCLVFQIMQANYVPHALADFLNDRRFTFMGVGIGDDVKKLEKDCGLTVGRVEDLRDLAASVLGRPDLKQRGLLALAEEVAGLRGLHKSKKVTLSLWDNRFLSWKQIKYAAMDGFLSFEIGRQLMAGCSKNRSLSPP